MSQTRRIRIGITMRETDAPDYHETRDALAQDWPAWMAVHLPDAQWLPIPNLGADAVSFARDWRLNGYVFSGGADPGQSPLRDATEAVLLEEAVALQHPVLGICRGLQLLVMHFQGRLTTTAHHVAIPHTVNATGAGKGWFGMTTFDVNSFHNLAISAGDFPADLVALAVDGAGDVEAATHRQLPLTGIMWHPERHGPHSMMAPSLHLIRRVFGLR
ncbi:MAG: glutamine amidotransferase [Gammaproteobacteria bacterium]|nr:glutamine amidotransferase [Gammaproteobacteria bacterium]